MSAAVLPASAVFPLKLKIEGDSVSPTTLNLAIAHLTNDVFWNEPSTKRFIFKQLPEYRLSKFQQALPESYSLEMLSDYLLDIPGAVLFLHMDLLSISLQIALPKQPGLDNND
jgi:ATP-dependent Lhr-like helicase